MGTAGRTRAVLALLAVVALVLAACGVDDGPAPAADEAPAADDAEPSPEPDDDAGEQPAPEPEQPVLSVVATVAPLTDLVGMVGGDRVEVTSLVPPGADSHTYEPRPGDVALLAQADAYLGVGLALNDGALRLAEENLPAGAPVVRLGEEALAEDDLVFDHVPDHDHGHDHGHDDGHDHGHDDGGHDHGHAHDDSVEPGPNPHVWTSLRNAARLVDRIAGVLTELDPEGADVYAANAAAARAELEALDRMIGDATATIPAAARTLVTYHDAWAYFARDHRLEYAVAIQPVDFSEPSAAEVRAVIDLVRELDVPAVFGSEVFPSSVLEAIAEETGATYVGDLADDVLPGRPGDPEHTYLGLMRRNAITIVEALGGDASLLRAAG
jgi:ABC-type Zn uptake system ZnuABC Zn-binding protein ZnuA